MEIVIEQARSSQHRAALRRIWRRVFEDEMGIALSRLDRAEDAFSLDFLAILEPDGEAVAALRVIETTSNEELHRRYGLAFDPNLRIARYTQLAVLNRYRGMNIPLILVLEAHRQFVGPGGFDFTWLLFDAERAQSSFLCRHLAFTPGANVFQAEYGLCRALTRDEYAPGSQEAIRQAERYIARLMKNHYPICQQSARARQSVFTIS